MASHAIPENAGPYVVSTAMAGNYIVKNHLTGKRQVIIPCRDREHPEEICERLNQGNHDGVIRASCIVGAGFWSRRRRLFCTLQQGASPKIPRTSCAKALHRSLKWSEHRRELCSIAVGRGCRQEAQRAGRLQPGTQVSGAALRAGGAYLDAVRTVNRSAGEFPAPPIRIGENRVRKKVFRGFAATG